MFKADGRALLLSATACTSLLLAACSDDDGGSGNGGSQASIPAPSSVEAGSRVALRVDDPEGLLTAGDFSWSADPELGTFEPFLPGASEVFLVTRGDNAEAGSLQARLGPGLSQLVLEAELQVDPILFAPAPAPTPFPGGDGRTILEAETAFLNDVLVVAYRLASNFTVLARFEDGEATSFTHFPAIGGLNGPETPSIQGMALGAEGEDLYLLIQGPNDLQNRLARYRIDAFTDTYQVDPSFLSPAVDYLALTNDSQGGIWVAAQENDPRLWRIDDAGQVVELVIWPSTADMDVRGLAVDAEAIVLASASSLIALQRADQSDQRSAAISGGEVSDVTLDGSGRIWISVVESGSAGSVRVLNARAEEVSSLSDWQTTTETRSFEQPLALVVDGDEDLWIFDDVSTGSDDSSAALAQWVRLRRQPQFPADPLTLNPMGGVFRIGAQIPFQAALESGTVADIRWSSSSDGLSLNQTLDGETNVFDAGVQEGTVSVTVSLVDDPSVRTSAYVTTEAINYTVGAEALGAGTNDDADIRASLATGGGDFYFVAYHNPAQGPAFVQRRRFDQPGNPSLGCEPGAMDCVGNPFTGGNPTWLHVAGDEEGNAYWIDAPMDAAPSLRRWRFINTSGNFNAVTLPDAGGNADVDRFLGSLIVGPPVVADTRAALYAAIQDVPEGETLIVRYDVIEPIQIVSHEIVAMVSVGVESPALALEPDGSLLVGDSQIPVLRFTPLPEGGFDEGAFAPGLVEPPRSLHVDADNRLYVLAESNPALLRILARSGQDLGATLFQYDTPAGGATSPFFQDVLGFCVHPTTGELRFVENGTFAEDDLTFPEQATTLGAASLGQ